MAETSTVQFISVRQDALTLWLTQTRRMAYWIGDTILTDDFGNGNFECKWQLDAANIKGENWHVPYFCSLGDWAGNITDMLTDFRYDALSFGIEEDYDQLLFRFYTRFMLVVSELVTDFSDLLAETKLLLDDETQIRKALSKTLNVHELFEYINSVCKHKVRQRGKRAHQTKLHSCNHHLPLFFEDSGLQSVFNNPLGVKNTKVTNPDGIVIPALRSLVQVVLDGYQELDKGFQNDRQKFIDFISHPEHGTYLEDTQDV